MSLYRGALLDVLRNQNLRMYNKRKYNNISLKSAKFIQQNSYKYENNAKIKFFFEKHKIKDIKNSAKFN